MTRMSMFLKIINYNDPDLYSSSWGHSMFKIPKRRYQNMVSPIWYRLFGIARYQIGVLGFFLLYFQRPIERLVCFNLITIPHPLKLNLEFLVSVQWLYCCRPVLSHHRRRRRKLRMQTWFKLVYLCWQWYRKN